MSATTSAWSDLYTAQTDAVGSALTATITGYGTAVAAIVSELTENEVIVDGGVAEAGGYNIQVLRSSLSGIPPKLTPITATGSATGASLLVHSVNTNNGVCYITAIDYGAIKQ